MNFRKILFLTSDIPSVTEEGFFITILTPHPCNVKIKLTIRNRLNLDCAVFASAKS